VEALSGEELFSVFGAYELSRVTLPHGYGVWGPSFFYLADAPSFLAPADPRVARLTPEQMSQVDPGLFWHCTLEPPSVGFGIRLDGALVALATVQPDASAVWEVGIDVVPDAKGCGLGRAVFGAAGRFILEQGRLVLGTVAPWNIPSTRTMRRLGMRHVMTALTTIPAPMRVPPQPLGAPLPGVELRNYYPDWAMNRSIGPKDE
jgi:RimJ/RimL family protein N-acetyltransferase